METVFTVVFKQGNTINTCDIKGYKLDDVLAFFHAGHVGNGFTVLAVMPTQVFKLLPDASVFLGIFPY